MNMPDTKKPPAPAVSIIVPVKDNQFGIDLLVRALEVQSDRSFELIIVDDASDAPITRPQCALEEIRILRLTTNVGQGEARNLGAAAARGKLLAFVDSDCAPNLDWVKTYRRLYGDGHPAIAGSFLSAESGNVVALLRSDESVFFHRQEPGPVNCFTSSNFAIDASLFAEIGGFPKVRVGEDYLLGYGLFIRNIDIFWFPKNTVSQSNRGRVILYLRQQFEWAKAAFVLQTLMPSAGAMKWNVRRGTLKAQIVMSSLMLLSLLSVLADWRGLYLAGLLLLSIVALNSSFLRYVARKRGLIICFKYLFIIVFLRNPCWLAALVRVMAAPRFWPAFICTRRQRVEAFDGLNDRLSAAAKSLEFISNVGVVSGYHSTSSFMGAERVGSSE